MDAASRRPQLWFQERRYADGLQTVDGILLLQNVHRLLEGEMLANAEPRRRLNAAATALRLGGAGAEQGVLHALIRSVFTRTGCLGARGLVEDESAPASEVRALCDESLRSRSAERLPAIAAFEIPYGIELFDAWLRGAFEMPDLSALQPPGGAAGTPPGPGARIAQLGRELFGRTGAPPAAELAGYLERMRRVAELEPADAVELHRAIREVDRESDGPIDAGAWHVYHRRLAELDAARALARVALAAAEFREREGRWPESLDALAPMFPEGVPVDPFDRRPFDYALTDGKARISARGRFEDAGPERSEKERRELALVWSLEAR